MYAYTNTKHQEHTYILTYKMVFNTCTEEDNTTIFHRSNQSDIDAMMNEEEEEEIPSDDLENRDDLIRLDMIGPFMKYLDRMEERNALTELEDDYSNQ
jgi:hypothetical protein